ncbi:hypothetical protein Taro_032709 [Colocasia esculenta]|uniref:Uncharacterized protein n=1 Tax=Colocasia esculenta TaxID=4460 RepID=A0A843VS15_COLES|nr:hypothetical protein [Colocasia esculenta]
MAAAAWCVLCLVSLFHLLSTNKKPFSNGREKEGAGGGVGELDYAVVTGMLSLEVVCHQRPGKRRSELEANCLWDDKWETTRTSFSFVGINKGWFYCLVGLVTGCSDFDLLDQAPTVAPKARADSEGGPYCLYGSAEPHVNAMVGLRGFAHGG